MSARTLPATLAAALAGGLLAWAAGIPAGLLLGAALGTLALGAAGAGGPVPDRLRDAAFAAIGLSLGSSIDRATLAKAADWPLSLLGMVAALALTWALCVAVLVRGSGFDRRTAFLSSAPGALGFTLALAQAERAADLRAVTLLQSTRLLAVTLTVPLLGLAGTGAPLPAREGMGLGASVLCLAAAVAAAPILERARVPAAAMLAGLAVGAGLHLAGVLEGPPDARLAGAGFVVTGAVIGTRLRGATLPEMRRLGRAAAAAAGTALACTWALAFLAAPLLGLPWLQLWLAWSPGGVEAMVAISLALDVDPAFVASHHVSRLLILFLVMPPIFRTLGR